MKSSFARLHPAINLIYFASVLLFSMFFLHPVFLIISLFSSFVYSAYLNGGKALKFNIVYLLPMLIFVAVINPLINHEGANIITYFNDNPITKESIYYGIATAMMFTAVIMWFSCYNTIITSDKFIHVFGRIIPALSLMFSMVMRFIPRFKAQFKKISNAQKCIGCDISQGNLIKRTKNGVKILLILTSWALENSIQTADSMSSRGYGLKGRTSFHMARFDNRDRFVMSVLILLNLIVLLGAVMGENSISYFPRIIVNPISLLSIFSYTSYAFLCLLPLALDILEELKWRHLKLKI